MDDLTTGKAIVEMLSASGPWGLVVVLGWAAWKVTFRLGSEIKVLYDRLISISEQHVAACVRQEKSLTDLKETIIKIVSEK